VITNNPKELLDEKLPLWRKFVTCASQYLQPINQLPLLQ